MSIRARDRQQADPQPAVNRRASTLRDREDAQVVARATGMIVDDMGRADDGNRLLEYAPKPTQLARAAIGRDRYPSERGWLDSQTADRRAA